MLWVYALIVGLSDFLSCIHKAVQDLCHQAHRILLMRRV